MSSEKIRRGLLAAALLMMSPDAFAQRYGDQDLLTERTTSAVKDEGGMFGAEAVNVASDLLRHEGRVPVVIETIKSIQEFGIGELAERRHKDRYPDAVYLLIANREHRISNVLVPANLADRLPEKDRQAVREAFLDGFKRRNYDSGLAQGVKAIESMLGKLDGQKPSEPRIVGVGRGALIERNQAHLTLEGARLLLKAAEEKAAEIRVKENIAVVDDGGNLLAFSRMDGARPGSAATAITKAVTAATFRQPTGTLPAGGDRPDPILNLSMQVAALQGGGKFTVLSGGVPIVVDGQVVGAVGVGGATGEQDAEVARAAVAAYLEGVKVSRNVQKTTEAAEKPKPEPEGEKKQERDPLEELKEGSKPDEPK